METYDVVVVGGGASGFFTAINTAALNPSLSILILERAKDVLQKVRISGGGRCNVTHAEFVPNLLAKNYPRGEKELKGPFHKFMTGDIMEWFEERGVALKIEEDGRVFPVSNSSESIINCFLKEVKKLNIRVETQQLVTKFEPLELGWKVTTKKTVWEAKKLVIATGSQTKIWEYLQNLGLKIVPPVPSLFTFNAINSDLKLLSGLSVSALVTVKGTKLKTEGPLLITHWGFSGPAILKLSAWGARILNELDYNFELVVNWTLLENFETCRDFLLSEKQENQKQQVYKNPLYKIPKRLWMFLVAQSDIKEGQRWADINKKQISKLANTLTLGSFKIQGKSTFKDEFVTAGGVDLKEVNFKTYQIEKLANCYLVGEAMNIDAITGGFNFQNAWTSGYIAARTIAAKN